jgi:hypothetical protein
MSPLLAEPGAPVLAQDVDVSGLDGAAFGPRRVTQANTLAS